MAERSAEYPLLGYIGYREDPQLGFMGGCLVVDSRSMPVEFRCTHPVKATTAQRIIYGEVFERHVVSEVIAGTLLDHIQTTPTVLFVENPLLRSVADGSSIPVALLFAVDEGQEAVSILPGDEAVLSFPESPGSDRHVLVHVLTDHPGSRDTIAEVCRQSAARFRLCEPFGRVRGVLEAVSKQQVQKVPSR